MKEPEEITDGEYEQIVERVLSVVDLADDGVIGVAEGSGVRRPRPLVAGGAVVGSVTGCSLE